ncbi:MAG: M4 family metallopeptidase, partial [Lysobacter sp.]|nr:M4 family metallopeptidase [Lysobacter sp.]
SVSCYPSGGFPASQTGKGAKYDPHFTSGVANRAFFLFAEGVTPQAGFSYTKAQLVCNSDTTIVGIGRAKAGAIWYRALTKYFVSSTDYPQARAGTLQAAADLYGANSVEYQTVARAWSAVKVN